MQNCYDIRVKSQQRQVMIFCQTVHIHVLLFGLDTEMAEVVDILPSKNEDVYSAWLISRILMTLWHTGFLTNLAQNTPVSAPVNIRQEIYLITRHKDEIEKNLHPKASICCLILIVLWHKEMILHRKETNCLPLLRPGYEPGRSRTFFNPFRPSYAYMRQYTGQRQATIYANAGLLLVGP